MMFVAHLALGRKLIDASLVALHEEILTKAGLPTRYEAGAFDELHDAMLRVGDAGGRREAIV